MLQYLASRFGKDSVVDVLAGTGLEQYSKDSGFGPYVVKAAVESSLQRDWAVELAEQKRPVEIQFSFVVLDLFAP